MIREHRKRFRLAASTFAEWLPLISHPSYEVSDHMQVRRTARGNFGGKVYFPMATYRSKSGREVFNIAGTKFDVRFATVHTFKTALNLKPFRVLFASKQFQIQELIVRGRSRIQILDAGFSSTTYDRAMRYLRDHD